MQDFSAGRHTIPLPKPLLYSMQSMITGKWPDPAPVAIKRTRQEMPSPLHSSLAGWIAAELDIRPYQHILEVGYDTGQMLQEVGILLQRGFLAGIDASMTSFRQAAKRNKKLIREQLLQLHTGDLYTLPYPHGYFHGIYGINLSWSGKERLNGLFQLAGMLLSRGAMVMLYPLQQEISMTTATNSFRRITEEMKEAGCGYVYCSYRSIRRETWIMIRAEKL